MNVSKKLLISALDELKIQIPDNLYPILVMRSRKRGGFTNHFFHVDPNSDLEIHPGNISTSNIEKTKDSPRRVIMRLDLLCKDCYNDLFIQTPYLFFPVDNCEVIARPISVQFIIWAAIVNGVVFSVIHENYLFIVISILLLVLLYHTNIMKRPIYTRLCPHA